MKKKKKKLGTMACACHPKYRRITVHVGLGTKQQQNPTRPYQKNKVGEKKKEGEGMLEC
jgi:hypothetical protein